MLEKLKSKLWIVMIPVAVMVLLSISAIKDIEKAHIELDNGKRTAYYLRSSTDSLTYLGAAYTATRDEKFIHQFNDHLERRKGMTFDIDKDALTYYNEGLRLSNLLATEIEKPAFKAMDSKAFFGDKYLSYKTGIINSIDSLRITVYNKSNSKLQRAILELNIYIYTLIFIVLGLVMFIKFNSTPLIKTKSTNKKKIPIKKSKNGKRRS
jgi:hypothetical protein